MAIYGAKRSNEGKIQVRASGVQMEQRAREEEKKRVGACVCVKCYSA